MSEPLELDDETYERITALSQSGEELFDQGKMKQALEKYKQALALVPEPVLDWEAATWLFAAIGDTYWLLADHEHAYEAFQDALRSPGGIGNPFIHMRVGQLDYEFGNMTKARDELIRAYMGAGREIFETEHEKYFSAIRDIV